MTTILVNNLANNINLILYYLMFPPNNYLHYIYLY